MVDWNWSEWLIIPAIIFGLIGLNLTLLIGVCLWEKYMVWPYATPDQSNSLPADARPSRPIPLSGYANLANGVARSLGFKSFGVFNDARRGIYQTCFFFWLSPARDVLAVIGNGTIAKIPLQSTVLYSLLNDGTCLVSIDNPQASQTDLTGLSFEAQNLGASFNRMVEWHRERVSEARTPVQPFSERNPLADLRAFRTMRTDLLESLGLARYLDLSRNSYRYTVRGAFAYTSRLMFKMVRRGFWPDTRK